MNPIPYSPSELEPKGYVSSFTGAQVPIFHTPVTPRENYIAALKGERPLWTPFFSDCKKFMSNIFPDNIARGMLLNAEHFDMTGFTGGLDMFGIDWEYVPEARGATVRPGNPFAEDMEELLEKVVWPDPDVWDWEGSAAHNKDYLQTDFALNSTIFCGYFERLISFLDFENAAVALIDDEQKEDVHAFFDRLTSLYEEIIPRMKHYFHLDALEFHDDWGSQRAPLISTGTVDEMILPYLKRVVDCTHEHGMLFEMHSCGHHPEHTPSLIAAGVDIWAPQANANDTRAIFEEYGDRITIGISTLLPPDAPEDAYLAWAEDFVEHCVGRPGMREPLLHNMRTPEILRRTVYELSRKKLCGSI